MITGKVSACVIVVILVAGIGFALTRDTIIANPATSPVYCVDVAQPVPSPNITESSFTTPAPHPLVSTTITRAPQSTTRPQRPLEPRLYPEYEASVSSATVSLFSEIFEKGDPDNIHEYNEKLWKNGHGKKFDALRLFNGNLTHAVGDTDDPVSPKALYERLLSHAVATNWGRSRGNASHPVMLCSPVTAVDFRYFLRSTMIDVPVLQHIVIVDGYNAHYAAAFLLGLRQTLYRHRPNDGAPDYFRVIHRRTIYGVSGNWNLCLKLAFESEEMSWVHVPYVMIKNADSIPIPGVMAPYAEWSLRAQDEGKFFVYLYAHTFFTMTRIAYQRLGLFDENMYPAYHEDSDMMIRCVVYAESVGKHSRYFEVVFPPTRDGKPNTVHARSVVLSSPGRSLFKEIFAKNRQVEYLTRKWKNPEPHLGEPHYPYPYNNSSNSVGWWRLDVGHRACLVGQNRWCPLS